MKFDEALEELNRLDVFLLDPVAGGTLVPFRKADDLAWFVFDHFAARRHRLRYHDDPIEKVRRLNLLPDVSEADLPRDERRRSGV